MTSRGHVDAAWRLDPGTVIAVVRSGVPIDGAQLRKLRERRGWTQAELARRARIRAQAISAYETGRHGALASALVRAAAALGVDVGQLLPPRTPRSLRVLRHEAGLTQQQLVDKLNASGRRVTRSAYAQWEQGVCQCHPHWFGPLAEALGVTSELVAAACRQTPARTAYVYTVPEPLARRLEIIKRDGEGLDDTMARVVALGLELIQAL
jgi:transcriptional regulator with XRE-family HTH domain